VTTLPEAAVAARIRVALDGANLGEVASQLRAHGDAVLAAGRPRLIAKAVRSLPSGDRTAHDHALLGLALVVLGDSESAESALLRDPGSLRTSHGWRLAMSRHLAGEPAAALDILSRVEPSDAAAFDEAQSLNWSAAASWMLGDEDACADRAEAARRVATHSGAPGVWAAAHSALALRAALTGDRRANAWHWHRALDAAQRAGDVLQGIRIRANLGSHLLEEGRYEAAAPGLAQAAKLARRVGFAAFEALSSCNLGECLLKLGRLDDAVACFDAARSAWQRTGSRMVAYAMNGLGDTYRERGDLVLAKAAYNEAVAASGPSHPQALVPALDGLARVLAPDDPAAAWRVAAQAELAARGIEQPRTRLTMGWLRLAAGATTEAVAVGRAVAEEAMRRRDRAALGEALELQAMCADHDSRSRLLTEAHAVWQEIGDVRASLRVAFALSRLSDDTGVEQLRAPVSLVGAAIENDPSGGCCRPHPAGLLAAVDAAAGQRVEIRVLGRFQVRRGTCAVDEREWQSRKARELVRVLVARRGRPMTREALAELLWPDEDPGQLANRLSVALATVRRVFDPTRVHPTSYFLRAEDGVVALDLAHLHIDVEDFLREGTAALARRFVEPEEAHRRLRRIVDEYPGEALAEDLYADWAIALRDEARTMHVAAARALAERMAEASPADAMPYLARVLDADPYDEPAHILLVGSLTALGRFGEARRAQLRYAARMTELGLSVARQSLPSDRGADMEDFRRG